MTSTKFITAALAFFTTFGFSSLLMQFALNQPEPQTAVYWRTAKPTNKQVLRFLQQDIKNGQDRLSRLTKDEWQYAPPFSRRSLAEYADVVADYVKKSGSMDDSQLPADLRSAWREHIAAWRDFSAFLNDLENASALDLQDYQVYEMYSQKDDRITETWFDVLKIAGENYGAFPAGAY